MDEMQRFDHINKKFLFSHAAKNSCLMNKEILGEQAVSGVYWLIQNGSKFRVRANYCVTDVIQHVCGIYVTFSP